MRGIQTKPTMIYRFGHTRLARIKMSGINKCWLGCREIEILIHSCGECKITHSFGKQPGVYSND